MNALIMSKSINDFYVTIKNWKFKDVDFFLKTKSDQPFVVVRNRRLHIAVYLRKERYLEECEGKMKVFTCTRKERTMQDFFDFYEDLHTASKRKNGNPN